MLNTEFKFFKDNRKQLLTNYSNKHIVIKGKKVIGKYDSHIEAYTETIKSAETGTFLITHCVPGKTWP